jgi:hypothetical protein
MLLYFMREPGGPVKIGITHVGATLVGDHTVEIRRKQIEKASGRHMGVLATTEGSRQRERRIHEQFERLRIVGEWFSPGSDLLGFITSLHSDGH